MSQGMGNFGTAGPDPAILSKVKGPAIALMVVGALDALSGLYVLVMNLTGAAQRQQQQQLQQLPPNLDAQQQQLVKSILEAQGPINIAIGCLGIILGGIMLLGGSKMMKLQGYGLAMTASIIALLPCTQCCFVSIPLGIWALVVLMKPEVKSAFQ